MIPSVMREVAERMRKDNPQASGQMTTADRAAAKAIHALADAMDKVAERGEKEAPDRPVALWSRNDDIITCNICKAQVIGIAGRVEQAKLIVLDHFKEVHPRAYPQLKKVLEQ